MKNKLLERLTATETVEFVLRASTVGGATQALVATNERLLIGKVGPTAGVTLGALITSFRYQDIIGIEARTGPLSGWIEVLTAAYQGARSPRFWSNDSREDPYKLPNCLPVPSRHMTSFAPYLELLRAKMEKARQPTHSAAAASQSFTPYLTTALTQLGALHDSGVLTDDEFAAAKSRLINP